jgi:hypothetical protein
MPRKKNGQDTAPRRVIHYKPGFERPKRGRRHVPQQGRLSARQSAKPMAPSFNETSTVAVVAIMYNLLLLKQMNRVQPPSPDNGLKTASPSLDRRPV